VKLACADNVVLVLLLGFPLLIHEILPAVVSDDLVRAVLPGEADDDALGRSPAEIDSFPHYRPLLLERHDEAGSARRQYATRVRVTSEDQQAVVVRPEVGEPAREFRVRVLDVFVDGAYVDSLASARVAVVLGH